MGSDAPWRREVPWEQDVVSRRVIKINDHIARGLERAVEEARANGVYAPGRDGEGGSAQIPVGAADRLRRAGDEATRAVQSDLGGSLGGMYRAVEELTAHPWDTSPARAEAAERLDHVLRRWGAGTLDAMMRANHDNDFSREVRGVVGLVRGNERARGSGLESVSSRIEKAKSSERSLAQAAPEREAEGPPANLRSQIATGPAQHMTRKM